MRIAVLDTSAIVRLYIPDGPLPDGLEAYVGAAWRTETSILTPDLALAEVTQVLRKKEQAKFLEPSEVDETLAAILALPLEIVAHRDLMPDALNLAREKNLTVYDSLFLALAIKKNAILITADRELARAFDTMATDP